MLITTVCARFTALLSVFGLLPWLLGSALTATPVREMTPEQAAQELAVKGRVNVRVNGQPRLLILAPGETSPVITSIAPDPIQPGAPITINGSNLPSSGTVSVRIGSLDLTGATLNAPPMGITANVPPSVPTGSQVLTLTLPDGVVVTRTVNVGTGGGTPPQYAITTFNPQPVAAGGQVTLTGTFPTGSVPVITLENGTNTAVATLTPGSNSASQVVATVPAGTASGTYVLKATFGTGNTSVVLMAPSFVVGTGGGTPPQYAITTFNPQPVAAGGQVTLTGTFPTGSVPVITLENVGSTTAVATLTPGSNSASQVVATVPAGTASGTYGLKVKFGTAGASGYAELGIQTFVVGTGGGTPPQYAITTFNPQPVAAGGQVTLTGTFPTGSVPVITLENAGGTTPVATLTPGSNSASQVVATVPAGTASGTYGLKVTFGTAGTSGYAELGIQTFVVGTGGGTTPQTITAQPANVTIPSGERTQLKVTATGAGTLTYQWYQGQSGITTTPISGATTPTFTTPALTATTGYWVRITDGNGAVTNSPTVTVTVSATSPLTVTQQVLGPGYNGGGAVVVTNLITYTGNAPSRIDWATLLPAGWKYLGSGGSEGGVRPTYESGDLLEWSWTTVPASPIKFSYMVSVPAGTTGDQVIASLITSQAVGTTYQTMAKPDPLVIRSASLHAADSDRDGRISLLELTRVIELYNYRSGTTRTGQYKPQAGTEDGFAPGP